MLIPSERACTSEASAIHSCPCSSSCNDSMLQMLPPKRPTPRNDSMLEMLQPRCQRLVVKASRRNEVYVLPNPRAPGRSRYATCARASFRIRCCSSDIRRHILYEVQQIVTKAGPCACRWGGGCSCAGRLVGKGQRCSVWQKES